MRRKSGPPEGTPEKLVRDIRRKTRRHWSAEETIRIVLEGLRGEYSIAELCRRKGIAESQYYSWSKEFLEAGKRRLAGDTARDATSGEVKDLRSEMTALKEAVADMDMIRLLWKGAQSLGLRGVGRRVASCWPFPVAVTIEGGRKLYVDLRSSIGRGLFVSGRFDMEAIRPALDALSEGAIFVDVGANVGFYSVLALDRIGCSGSVYSFEIDRRPLHCLRKSVVEFGYSNIHVIEAAVSDLDGTLAFEPNSEHGHNQIDRNAIGSREIRSVRLDTWAEDIGLRRVEVIKIDVEGAEKFVLEGAREIISRFKPVILCEADTKTTGAFGYTPHELIAQFEALNYTTSWLDDVFTPTILARPRR